MGQAEEIERLLKEYLIEYKKHIHQNSALKAMQEAGLHPEIIKQVLKIVG